MTDPDNSAPFRPSADELLGNNAGFVLSIGLVIVFAAVALLTYAAVTAKDRIEPFDDAHAEALEQQVQSLVQSGAPEEQVRALVRDAMRVGRR